MSKLYINMNIVEKPKFVNKIMENEIYNLDYSFTNCGKTIKRFPSKQFEGAYRLDV